MALEAPQLNQVTVLSNIMKQFGALDAEIEDMDVLFNGDADWAALVTQEAVNAVPSFAAAGLTAANILDALYLAKTARAAWRANLPAMVALKSLR
jgi:hypothetical protein